MISSCIKTLDLNMSKKETQQIKKKKISLKKCMVIKNK
jgi:hypothetical protein